jgi:hypothetical protein
MAAGVSCRGVREARGTPRLLKGQGVAFWMFWMSLGCAHVRCRIARLVVSTSITVAQGIAQAAIEHASEGRRGWRRES